MRKNIIAFIRLCLLTTTFYDGTYASEESAADNVVSEKTIDEKIKETDEKIRKKEQLLQSNGSEIQKLVDQYNALIQERATKVEAKTTEPIEQRTEDAIIERLKAHENRIDILEKEVIALKTLIQKIAPSGALHEEKAEHNKKPRIEEQGSITQKEALIVNGHKTPTGTPELAKTASTNPEISESKTKDTHNAHATATAHAADTKATEAALKSDTIPTINTKSPALAQYNQAMTLLDEHNDRAYAKAAKAFEFIIEAFPDDEYANKSYLHAGDAYHKIGKLDEAKHYYKAAITKLLPAHSVINARLGLAEVYLKNADKEKAAEQIKMLKREKFMEDQRNRFDQIKQILINKVP